MKVLVVGATGVLGRNVILRLVEAGHSVRAVVRREEQARFLQQWQGVEALIGDISDRQSLERAASGAQAALHLATAIPKNDSQDWSQNDRVRMEGTRNLLDALVIQGVRRYVQQSIVLVYGKQGNEIVDETALLQMTAINRSAIEMEEMVRASGLAWSILRGGLFYGPGTGREEGWWQAARQGVLKIPSHTLIWTAGVKAAEVIETLNVERASAGRVRVESTLQLPGHPEFFVIGDAAYLLDQQGQPLPMLSTVAIQQGTHTAYNIKRLLIKAEPKPFQYKDPNLLATIGHNAAVARIWGISFSGFIAWVIWVFLHIFRLVGFRNRILVFINWTWDYLFRENQVRLISKE
jgi:uncharacterized protein YbjT (DUF2867 family)